MAGRGGPVVGYCVGCCRVGTELQQGALGGCSSFVQFAPWWHVSVSLMISVQEEGKHIPIHLGISWLKAAVPGKLAVIRVCDRL